MSSTNTSSRSSMSSASALLYRPEFLLQLADSRGAQSSTAASANLLQLDAQRFFADILVESDESASSRASSRLSAHSSSPSEDQDDQESEEDDDFVYGEGMLRSDLSAETVEQLRKAVYLALDKPSYPTVTSSPITSNLKPAAVMVSTNTNRLPLVYNTSIGGRINQRRANPGGVFGRPRKSTPSGCGPASAGVVQNSNTTVTSNSERESWRPSVFARRTETPRISKEADSDSWRRMEPGARWAWNDNAGYVVIKA